MYKDLSKNSETKDDWLIQGDAVIQEVFDTISHTSKGDIFYARNLGSQLEELLFSLGDENIKVKVWNILSEYRSMDGRMSFNMSKTTITEEENNPRQINVTTTTSRGVDVTTILD